MATELVSLSDLRSQLFSRVHGLQSAPLKLKVYNRRKLYHLTIEPRPDKLKRPYTKKKTAVRPLS